MLNSTQVHIVLLTLIVQKLYVSFSLNTLKKPLEQSIDIHKQLKIPKVGMVPLYTVIVVFVFILAILQDYIYSRLRDTGFYLSESLLYNTFWFFFIPFSMYITRLLSVINPQNKWSKLLSSLGTGIAFSVLHILSFTSLFVIISNLVFTPAHHFSNILSAAFSNQFYIALLWYSIFPVIYTSKEHSTDSTTVFLEKIKLKKGLKIITIPTSSIQFISTDKPYSIVCTNDQKFLDTKSLKDFETELDPSIFLRVHRSTIINSNFIKELKSRSNGDYDATLKSGQVFRLSRHYRTNWRQLLQ